MAPPPRVFRLLPGAAASCLAGNPPERRCVRYARRDRTAIAGAILVSVLLHALVVAFRPAVTISVTRRLDSVEARPFMEVIRVREADAREPAPAPVATAARPVLTPDIPAVNLPDAHPAPRGLDLELAAAATPDARLVLRPGVPVPAASGDGDLYVRPVALSILTNWRPRVPSDGVETTIRVHTDAAGHATGLVELVPRTPSRLLNEEIVARVRQLTFQPALRDGEPIAAWAEITLIICHDGVTATSPASPSGLESPCADDVRVTPAKTGG